MPRCCLLLPLAAMLMAVGVRAEDKPKVEPFTSKEGKFSINFPAKPTKQTQKVKTPVGEIELHFHIVEQKPRTFAVSVTDNPKGVITDANREKVLDSSRNSTVKGMK